MSEEPTDAVQLINAPKLVIIPGVGKNSETLSKSVRDILRTDFKLGERVSVFFPMSDDKLRGVPRNSFRGFTQGYFNDHDPRAECGKLALARVVDNNYIALVRYMEDPSMDHSINDDLMHIRGIGSLLRKVNPARIVLAVPYLPFLRSHSIAKYEAMGFLQADMLSIFVEELKLAGIDKVISIEPHSDKFIDVAKDQRIATTIFSPFSNPAQINYLKLGFKTEQEAKTVLRNLSVFSYLVREQYNDAYLVLPDDNAEQMGEAFACCSGIPFEHLVAFNKVRMGEGDSKALGIKSWCVPKPKDLEGKTIIIPDDMISGGGTVDDLARDLKKNYNVARVIAMVAHPVCPDPGRIEKLDAIDQIYCLGTIPQQIKKLTVLDSYPYMLAAGLFKSYKNHEQRLEAQFKTAK